MPSSAVKQQVSKGMALWMQVAIVLCVLVPIGTLENGESVSTLQAALLYAWNGCGWLSSLFFLTLYFGFPVLAGYLTLKRPPRGNYLVCVLISAGEALSAACFYTALAPLDGTVFTLSPMRYALMIVMGVGIAAYIGAYLTAWDGSN